MSHQTQRRRLWIAILSAMLISGGAGVAHALSGDPPSSSSGDNTVVLINSVDGRSFERAATSIQRPLGDVVDNENAATAFSRCSHCRTVAVAVQVVLVMGNPSTVAPRNYAIAWNQDCSDCYSMAAAYQYVIATDGVVHFTAEGETQISAIRRQIDDVAGSGASFNEIASQLDDLTSRLWGLVDQELVYAGVPFSASPHRRISIDISNGGTASPSPSSSGTTPSPSSSPSATIEPSTIPPTDVSPSAGDTAATSSPSASATSPSSTPAPDPTSTSSSDAPASPSPSESASPSPSPTDPTPSP